MLEMSYNTISYFEYKDKSEMEKIHEHDEIKEVKFIEEENLIQYTFDRKFYIRLSDLVYWIESDFIRFRHGQLLQLFVQLIVKVENLQSMNIEHGFLTLDRVWLCLEPNSQCLSIIYKAIAYSIIFTGYQHPLYEECKSTSTNDEISMKQLIKEIINRCMNHLQIIKNDQKIKEQTLNEIYNQLLDQIDKLSLLQIKLDILQIQADYDYDTKLQAIIIDEIEQDGPNSIREGLIQAVRQDLAQILIKYRGQQLVLEHAFYKAIEEISKQINGKKSYKSILPNYDLLEKQCLETFQKIESFKQEYANNSKAHLDQCMGKLLEKFKLQIDVQKETIFNKIIQQLGKQIRFSYVYNSIWIIKKKSGDIENLILKITELCVMPLVEAEVEGYLGLQIIQMIDDLI